MRYESNIKQVQKNNKTANAIAFILNNLNIRHNNETKDNEYMKIIGDDLEQWYDDLYSLFICYIIENEKNSKKVGGCFFFFFCTYLLLEQVTDIFHLKLSKTGFSPALLAGSSENRPGYLRQ